MASAMDKITMQNVDSTLAKWSPDSPCHLHAIVDMGSNGIRFSISDLTPPRTRLLACVYRERAAISLFDSLTEDKTGTLIFRPDTIQQVGQTVSRFSAIAMDYGVPLSQFSIFATEAMRRAANAQDMLQAIRAAAPGLTVHILEPQVETLFGSMGARSSFFGVKGLFLDLGGGSMQLSYVNTNHADYECNAAQTGHSMPFGAARLIGALNHDDRRVKTSALSDVDREMREKVASLCGRFEDLAEELQQGVDVFLCGGGFRGYGSILMHSDPISPYPIPLIGHYRVSGDHFRDTKRMRKINIDTKTKILGMSKRRRTQFEAVATVVDALVQAVPKIRTVTFCAGGNREGALMMKLPPAVREEDPLALLAASPSPSPGGPPTPPSAPALQAVVDILQASLPPTPAPVLPGLLPVLARRAWEGLGRDADTNASAALTDAAARDADHPGLTHQLRAALALALWARWGAAVAPANKQLRENLDRVAGGGTAGGKDAFFAEYLGAVAAAMVMVMPTFPKGPKQVQRRFQRVTCTMQKNEVVLTWVLSSDAVVGLDVQDVQDCLKGVGGKYAPYVVRMDLPG